MKGRIRFIKRIIALILVVTTTFGIIPEVNLVNAKPENNIYGDVNDDKKVSNKDIYMLRKYIEEGTDKNTQHLISINETNADVNNDGSIDEKDIEVIKQYLAAWKVNLGPEAVTVTFVANNDNVNDVILPQTLHTGDVVEDIPSPKKDGYVFKEWTKDEAGNEKFYPDTPLTGDLTLYAQYNKLEEQQDVTINSFSKMDQDKSVKYYVTAKSDLSEAEVKNLLILKNVNDGTSLDLQVTKKDGNYEIAPPKDGYEEGISYSLELKDGLSFKDKEDSIRIANFSIKQKESNNLPLKEDGSVKYIKDTAAMSYTLSDGSTKDVISVGMLNSNTKEKTVGSFTYGSANSLKTGDILCIYEKTSPLVRNDLNADYTDDAVAYMKVTGIAGNKVSFTSLDEEDAQDVMDLPDVIPFKISNGFNFQSTSYVFDKSKYDVDAWNKMGVNTSKNPVELSSVGDFVVVYDDDFDNMNNDTNVWYGKVTSVDSLGNITASKVSKETMDSELENRVNYYNSTEANPDDILNSIDKEKLTKSIETQAFASGFATDSVKYLAQMALETPSAKKIQGLEKITITDQYGNDAAPMLRSGGISKEIKLTDAVKFKVDIGKSNKYFDKGIKVGINLSAEFEVKCAGGKLKILLSASFVEEIAIDIGVKVNTKWKWYVFVPVLKEVKVNSNLDLKNYSGVSLDVKIYTVEADEEEDFDALKELKEKGGDTLKKIEENKDKLKGLNDKIKKAKEAYEKAKKFLDDHKEDIDKLKDLKDQAEKAYKTFNEYKDQADEYAGKIQDLCAATEIVSGTEFKTAGEMFDKYNNISEKLDGKNVTDELNKLVGNEDKDDKDDKDEGIDAGLKDFVAEYKKMLENDCDWIELFKKEIFQKDFNPDSLGIVQFGIEVDFVIKGKINIALSANMEYVIGKRYTFGFNLFEKSAYTGEMDILDEKFAFQFYVMGALGLKVGFEAEVCVGLLSTKLDSIGITAEFGPYVELYGYIIYEYTKLRPANTTDWQTEERMQGALYIEFGLYLDVTFKAQVLNDKFKYEKDIYSHEWPLLTAGDRYNIYQFGYSLDDDVKFRVTDNDNNSTNGYTTTLPESYREVTILDLKEGDTDKKVLDLNQFSYSLSNENFKFDPETGKITATPPEGISYMECDLKITWKGGKLAFSLHDMSATVHLVWTNLSNQEIKEPLTASVKVGNVHDGYKTVWSKKVIKGQYFDLPGQTEVLDMIGFDKYASEYGNLKYASVGGYYNVPKITDTTINVDTDFLYNIDTNEYQVTVNGIVNKDGSTTSKTLKAKYGESFSTSELEKTGADNDSKKLYSSFSQVSLKNGNHKFTNAIDNIYAKDLLSKSNEYTAEYKNEAVNVTIEFAGANIDPINMIIKKGTVPQFDVDDKLVEQGKMIKSYTPDLAPLYADTKMVVSCEPTNAPYHSIIFNTDGGEEIKTIKAPEGARVVMPQEPKKTGYDFIGWYTDKEFNNEFTPFSIMPVGQGDINLYAKWEVKRYFLMYITTIGDFENGKLKVVKYGSPIGKLLELSDTNYSFLGWYTEQEGGIKINETDIYNKAEGMKIYAHWKLKTELSDNNVTFAKIQQTYGKNLYPEVNIQAVDNIKFNVTYKKQGTDQWVRDVPHNVGTYDVRVQRDADNYYTAYEKTGIAYIIINKATRSNNPTSDYAMAQDIKYSTACIRGYVDGCSSGKIDINIYSYTLNPNDKFLNKRLVKKFSKNIKNGNYNFDSQTIVGNLLPNGTYFIACSIYGDENYEDCIMSKAELDTYQKYNIFKTKSLPTESWINDTSTETNRAYNKIKTVIDQSNKKPVIDINDKYDLIAAAKLFKNYNTAKSCTDIKLNFKSSVNLDGKLWEPMNFSAGLGHNVEISGDSRIYNMLINDSSENSVGFMRGAKKLTTQGVQFEDCYLETNKNNAGMLAGYIGEQISITPYGVNLSGSCVRGVTNVGGVIGHIDNATGEIRNARIERDSYISGFQNVGGIVGAADGTGTDDAKLCKLVYCENYADIDATSVCAGGLVGKAWQTSIDNNKNYRAGVKDLTKEGSNYGYIRGYGNVGGIVGWCEDTTICGNINFGEVWSGNRNGMAGGIVGTARSNDKIYTCYNMGNISAYNISGGIAGVTGEKNSNTAIVLIAACGNIGDITATECTGGIVGFNYDDLDIFILDNYNYGIISEVSDKKAYGQIVGRNYSSRSTVDGNRAVTDRYIGDGSGKGTCVNYGISLANANSISDYFKKNSVIGNNIPDRDHIKFFNGYYYTGLENAKSFTIGV